MAQVFRITFDHQDYSFRILNAQLSAETEEIHVLINGNTQALVKDKQNWIPKENQETIPSKLAIAIGRVIALRYRI